MNNTDDIIERLKGHKPVIDNPDELTDFIMDNLPEQRCGGIVKRYDMLSIIKVVSSVAAVMVAGIFIFDLATNDEAIKVNTTAYRNHSEMPSSSIRNMYERYRKNQNKTITYTEIIRYAYEKN